MSALLVLPSEAEGKDGVIVQYSDGGLSAATGAVDSRPRPATMDVMNPFAATRKSTCCASTLRLWTWCTVLRLNSWKILLCSFQKMYQRCCRLQAKARSHGGDEPFDNKRQEAHNIDLGRLRVDSAFVKLEQCAEAEVMEDPLVLLAEGASEVL